ncbi:MAG: hypothetical protein DMF50_08085 [Acidobacteria bacterium]|nr:MAG: hypothetical protein DMF50_08085 [Acidobacteriota bacterium]
MNLPAFAHLATTVLASVQESLAPAASGPTADTVAAQPAVAARGFRFLIGAYTAVWMILALYLLSLSVRLRALSRQVRRLKEQP